MTIKRFIEKAIEGGWRPHTPFEYLTGTRQGRPEREAVLFDPEAWKAVGKVEGWDMDEEWKNSNGEMEPVWSVPQKKQAEMLEALWNGETIEQYLETL